MSLKSMLTPKFQEPEEDTILTETSVEVEVQVAEKVEEAIEVEGDIAEIDDQVEEMEEGDANAEVIEEVKDIVAEEGYTVGVARMINAMGITEAIMAQSKIVIPGHESLNATGKNEEMAQLVIAGCEAMLDTWKKNVRAFFKWIVEKVRALIARIMAIFQSYEKAVPAAYKNLQAAKVDEAKALEVKRNVISAGTFADIVNGYTNDYAEMEKSLDSVRAKADEYASAGADARKKLIDEVKNNEKSVGKLKGVSLNESKSLKELGWTKDKALKAHDQTMTTLKIIGKMKVMVSKFEALEKAAIELERLDSGKEDVAKAKTAYYKAVASSNATTLNVLIKAGMSLCRTFVVVANTFAGAKEKAAADTK